MKLKKLGALDWLSMFVVVAGWIYLAVEVFIFPELIADSKFREIQVFLVWTGFVGVPVSVYRLLTGGKHG